MFVGRERERARIDRLLQDARAGRSATLLLHGEAGIGKTALMRWAIGQATGMRVLRARGIETESDIPFAGLAELVTPLLDRLDDIPDVQARALRGALALGPATPHDRFTVPAGLLSLLAVAAEEQPVLVSIDDAQWLDEASLEAFLFAGRRLEAEGVAMLGSLRDGDRGGDHGRAVAGAPGRSAARPTGRRASCSARASRSGSRPRSPTGWSAPRPATRWRCWRSRACSRTASAPAASRWRSRCGPAPGSSGRSGARSTRSTTTPAGRSCWPPPPTRAGSR